MGERGVEQRSNSAGKSQSDPPRSILVATVDTETAQPSVALDPTSTIVDPDLYSVVRCWPILNQSARKHILDVVRVANQSIGNK